MGFTANTKFMLLQMSQRKFWSTATYISYILSITNFVHFIDPQISARLDGQFRRFDQYLYEPVTLSPLEIERFNL